MNEKQKAKEKTCVFYASDYHFEMISLPYIDKKIEEQEKIIIITENNLEKSIETLLTRTNFKESKKQAIRQLNWNNNNAEKIQNIQEEKEEEKPVTIFIKGKKEYIKQMNQNLEEKAQKNANIKIIDCYNVEEIGEEIQQIKEQYKHILKTSGEEAIKI